MNRGRVSLVSLILSSLCAPVRAQVDVSLPLEGYFRPGRYMPVHLRGGADAPQGDVTIGGEGIVPTIVSVRGGEIIVPVLVKSAAARELVVSSATGAKPIRLPLRELPSDRQMIGLVRGSRDPLERFIPPASTIVRVELDRAAVRAAPPIAMELLQSLLLDDPTLVGDAGTWLAGGVQLLLVEHPPPDRDWPWVEVEGVSLLRADVLGPRSSLLGEEAYLPAQGWSPGRLAALRRQVVLAGALFAIAAVACALLPRRAVALASLALVTMVASAAIYVWQRAHSPLNLLAGQVAVDHGTVAQWDRWTYYTSRPIATGSMPFNGAVRPALVNAAQADANKLRLHWSDDESRRFFEFEVGSGATIGFISRTMMPMPRVSDEAPQRAPGGFAALAGALYRDDRYAVAGQVDRSGVPVVIVIRKP